MKQNIKGKKSYSPIRLLNIKLKIFNKILVTEFTSMQEGDTHG